MSRHRDAVNQLVEGIAAMIHDALTDEVVQQLTLDGRLQITLSPLSDRVDDQGLLSAAIARVRETVRAATIDECRDLKIEITLAPRERIGRCIAGDALASRRLAMVEVLVTARLRTRWVDMHSEKQTTRQWVVA
jgi:hypothetical protein